MVIAYFLLVSDGDYLGCQGKGWVDYKGSCYLFRQEKSDWNDALRSCRTEGGDLASINDKDESDFILSQLPKGILYMSLVVRKPVFGVSDQVRHKPGCTATEND